MNGWTHSLPISPADGPDLECNAVCEEVCEMFREPEILRPWIEDGEYELPAELVARLALSDGDDLLAAQAQLVRVIWDEFTDADNNRMAAYERLVARGQRDAEEAA